MIPDREAVTDVVDVGVWTFGLVSAGVLVHWRYVEAGVESALLAVLLVLVLVVALGVTGRAAVASIGAVVGDDVGEGQR